MKLEFMKLKVDRPTDQVILSSACSLEGLGLKRS